MNRDMLKSGVVLDILIKKRLKNIGLSTDIECVKILNCDKLRKERSNHE